MIIELEKNDSIMIKARNGHVKMFVDDNQDLQIMVDKVPRENIAISDIN